MELRRRFNLMMEGLKQKDLIEETFGRYVDKKIARDLMKKPDLLKLGGEHHVVTIMMADLRGFTQAAERMSPDKVIKLLNRHFSRMISVIEKYDGIIVDFYGDSVLAFFNGVNSDVASRAAEAVNCALEMQREAERASEQNRRDGLPALAMGIGIHTGDVVVGNIGSEKRAKYGIVGSAVNETDRIQSLAQEGAIMISARTYELISDRVVMSGKSQVRLKGLSGVRDLYLVEAMDSPHLPVAQSTEIDCPERDPA
jgi:adenylate cyclase